MKNINLEVESLSTLKLETLCSVGLLTGHAGGGFTFEAKHKKYNFVCVWQFENYDHEHETINLSYKDIVEICYKFLRELDYKFLDIDEQKNNRKNAPG